MADKKNNGGKGNPASKRIGNAHRKAYRASLWVAQERRKDDREVEALKANARNEERRKRGDKTPWEISKNNRSIKRAIRRKAEEAAARLR